MRPLRNLAVRTAYRVGYWGLRVLTLIDRRPSRGVKCLITSHGRVLLVRHTYGPRRDWHVPGGRRRRSEDPRTAAEREMHEELGLAGMQWRVLAQLRLRLEGRAAIVDCLHADVGDVTLERDVAEIAEVRWFAPEQVPERLGRGEMQVLRVLSLPFATPSGQTDE